MLDHLWVWSHDVQFDWNAHEAGQSPARNHTTPVEGARYLGVPNILFIQYQGAPTPPFESYFEPFKSMRRVYWTLSNNGNQEHQLGAEQEHVYRLAAANPNIVGLLLDDFLIGPDTGEPDPHWLAANYATFPVPLEIRLPEPAEADGLLLAQTDWPGAGYRTARLEIETSLDGATWQRVARSVLPDRPRAERTVRFRRHRLQYLRVVVLTTHDTTVAMSCGLRSLRLLLGRRVVPIANATARADSEYPGHEAARLLSQPAPLSRPRFSSQVSPRDLAVAKGRMQSLGGRRLDLAVVVYSHQLDPAIVPILKDVDTVLFWTWQSSDLAHLEINFGRLRRLLPGKRVILGCYLWDFAAMKPIPPALMERQCNAGLRWLKRGQVDGMIFLGTNVMDKGLQSIEWTRRWITRVGGTRL